MKAPHRLLGSWLYRRFFSAERRQRRRLAGSPAAELSPQYWGTVDLLWLIARDDASLRTIWDVGANRGHWVILARSVFPGASLVCFEPMATHLDELETTCRRLGSARVFACAAGSVAGDATFHETEFSDCSSLLAPNGEGKFANALRLRRKTRVTVKRLDDLAREHALPAPDLIKCDIQGGELEALRGAAGLLTSVRWLLIEVQFVAAYENAARPAELIAFLDSHGFDLVGLERDTESWENLHQADLLFRKRGSAASPTAR